MKDRTPSILNNSEQKKNTMGWRRWRVKSSKLGARVRRHMEGIFETSSSFSCSSSSLLPLIISGSALMLVLGYFYSFFHFHENNSRTNRPTCVSKYIKLRTIEEEKWGMWVHPRWKLTRENTGISEVFPHMVSNQVFLLDTVQRGRLEQLSFGFSWYTTWQAVETFSNKTLKAFWNSLLSNSPNVWFTATHCLYLQNVMCISWRYIVLYLRCKPTANRSPFVMMMSCTKHIQYLATLLTHFWQVHVQIFCWCVDDQISRSGFIHVQDVSARGFSPAHCCTRYTLLPQI